jgi:hypothetical protein
MDSKVFRRDGRDRGFDGTFYTDGYGASILKRNPNAGKGAGKPRKHGERRKDRDHRLFPPLDTIDRNELRQYQDVVFINPDI